MTTELVNIEFKKRLQTAAGMLELTVYREGLPRMCPVDEIGFGVLIGKHNEIETKNVASNIIEFPMWSSWAKHNVPTDVSICLPIYVYKYRDNWIVSTKRLPEEWNWVQFGYYYVTKSELKKRYNRRSVSSRMKLNMEDKMKKYLRYMEDWLNNNVYEYVAKIDDKVVACQCGFYECGSSTKMIHEIIEHAAEEGHEDFKLMLEK